MFKYLYVLIFILADFFSKRLAVQFLKDNTAIEILPGILRLSYVENTGAAFGIMQNMRWFFVVLTVIIILVFMYIQKTKMNKTRFFDTGVLFVISGAIGNFIDRLCLGYVVDFIDFYLIDFPVFNIADIFVCIGTGLICIHYLFFEKEEKEIENG